MRCRWAQRSSTRDWCTARTLQKLDQTDGFDCISCAWLGPHPERRHKGIGKASVRLSDVYSAELIMGPVRTPETTTL